jgi:CRP/FNR family transcriptional regulator
LIKRAKEDAALLQSVTERCQDDVLPFVAAVNVGLEDFPDRCFEEPTMTSTATAMPSTRARVSQPSPRVHSAARPADRIDLDQLRSHVQVLRRRLEPGQYLYRAGQAMQALFLIHVGSMKTCELSEDGREQVTGFRMAGELLGVESIGLTTYACDVIALESSEVWELPYPPVLTACLRMPELQQRLTDAMAEEIRRNRSWMLALGTLSAEQRVAAFLLDVAARYEALGFSGSHFILRMSRADMASYLALKHETVSRALSHLCDENYIAVERREMRIINRENMLRMAGFSSRVH